MKQEGLKCRYELMLHISLLLSSICTSFSHQVLYFKYTLGRKHTYSSL